MICVSLQRQSFKFPEYVKKIYLKTLVVYFSCSFNPPPPKRGHYFAALRKNMATLEILPVRNNNTDCNDPSKGLYFVVSMSVKKQAFSALF